MTPDIFFTAADGAPSYQQPLLNPDGSAMDLTGRTVVFRYQLRNRSAARVQEAVAVVAPATDGVVRWTPVAALALGNYDCNWVVDAGLPTQVTIPNGGPDVLEPRYLWMKVQAGL